MIKIKEIDKTETKNYFIIYEIDKKVYSFSGSSEDIFKDLYESMKDKNEQ